MIRRPAVALAGQTTRERACKTLSPNAPIQQAPR
jgi:hypothetical protein